LSLEYRADVGISLFLDKARIYRIVQEWQIPNPGNGLATADVVFSQSNSNGWYNQNETDWSG